jgi:hypothetical protein
VDGPIDGRREEPRQPSWSSATGRESTRRRSGTSSLASPSPVRARQRRDARSDLWAASWSHPTAWPCSCSRDRRRHSWTKKARGRRSRSIASWRRCVSNLPTRGRDGFASHMGSGNDSAVVGKVVRISLRRAARTRPICARANSAGRRCTERYVRGRGWPISRHAGASLTWSATDATLRLVAGPLAVHCLGHGHVVPAIRGRCRPWKSGRGSAKSFRLM